LAVGSAHQRGSHSVPTRRSSDLAAGIPYPVIGAVEVVDDFLQGCSPPGVKVDVDGGRLALVGGRLQGKSLPGPGHQAAVQVAPRSEEHTSELQSRENLVCRLLLE